MRAVAFVSLILLAACGHVRTDGGQANFDRELYNTLGPAEQLTYAQTVVKREERDPEGIKLAQLKKKKPLKRMGLILFETQFQTSRTGLAVGRNVYLSARGKQVLTEHAFWFWLERLGKASGVEWVHRKALEKSAAFRSYGSVVQDRILRLKVELNEDDIFWKSGGQEIPMESLLLPRNQQDVSILYIPATEMMITTKMVAHQNHWVNDICKELKLDGVVLVSLAASWDQGGVDKRTQEKIPEEMKVSVESSILYPFTAYHDAAREKGSDLPKKNVTLATYAVKTSLPVTITVPENEQNFATIQKNIVAPLEATYKDLSGLVIERMISDIESTH